LKELHFHLDWEELVLSGGHSSTYRLGDRRDEYEIDDEVRLIVDDKPPRVLGKARILKATLIYADTLSDLQLDLLEIYYGSRVRETPFFTFVEFELENK